MSPLCKEDIHPINVPSHVKTSLFYLLLPLAFISSLVLIGSWRATNTKFFGYCKYCRRKQTKYHYGTCGSSLESIKALGENGGGYFGANSAHPFENPTGLSNTYEMLLMLVIPLSFPIAYAKLLGKGRGISILVAMLVGFGSLLAFGFLTHVSSSLIETRFGNFGSILFNMIFNFVQYGSN